MPDTGTTEPQIGSITCPRCGHKQSMPIPTNMCIPFYICDGCHELIAAEKGCCVFCDFGDMPCPVSKQHG